MKAQDFLTELYELETDFTENGPGENRRQVLVSHCIRFIEDAFSLGEVAVVDESLRDLKVEDRSPYVLVAMLRGSYRARSIMIHWHSLRDRICAELVRQGEDDARILVGLKTEPTPVWTEGMIAKVKQDAELIASKMRQPSFLDDDE